MKSNNNNHNKEVNNKEVNNNEVNNKEVNNKEVNKYSYIYVPCENKKKSKMNPCNSINKHVNKYNKKNDKFYNPDQTYMKGFKYMTNSDIYY